MVNVAIVEDDERWTDILRSYLHRYEEETDIRFCIRSYTDGSQICGAYPKDLDVILMDIEMGLMNGMAAAREIRDMDEVVEIIFVTNMAQYAISGYQVRALDYILKPIEYVPFCESLKRALRSVKQKERFFLHIPAREGNQRVLTSQICWVESHGHRLTFHLKDGQTLQSTVYSMKEVEEKLSSQGFARCSSGCLVNLLEVTSFHEGEVIVQGEKLPISRGKRKSFLSALAKHMSL